jgi:nucleolar complex protein 2
MMLWLLLHRYVRNARFINDQSMPVVTFMGNCVVELCAVDLQAAYQHAFVYVRQLAMALRNAMVSKCSHW